MLKVIVNRIMSEPEPGVRLLLARELRAGFLGCVESVHDNVEFPCAALGDSFGKNTPPHGKISENDQVKGLIRENQPAAEIYCDPDVGDDVFPKDFQEFAKNLASKRRKLQ